MRLLIILTFIASFNFTTFGQVNQNEKEIGKEFSYAYISISGKLFSKKLNVVVDLGDTPEEKKLGQEYSQTLTNKTSYAAILNYMVDNEFELVETLTLQEISSYQGTGGGGTAGIIFIMKKRK